MGRRRGLWGGRINADIADFVLDMFYMIDSDLSKKVKGDVHTEIKVWRI